MPLEVHIEGDALCVEVGRDTVTVIDEATTDLRVEPLGHRAFRVGPTSGDRSPDRSTVAWAVRDGNAVWVFVDGEVMIVDLQTSQNRSARRITSSHDALTTPMPATVVRLLVRPGDRAVKGMPLAILEAMKMELPLRAPRNGMIRSVMCREGDLVQPGRPLIELD